jgi:hypothetical protein
MKKLVSKVNQNDDYMPLMVAEGSVDPTTNTRRNVAGTIERTDRFKNIEDGLVPFKSHGGNGSSSGSVDVRDAIILCQKCYYNFAIFRNIIDLMTEFSVNNIFWRGGNSKSRDFFKAFSAKHNFWDLQDRIYREYYRSGTVALFRYDYEIDPSDAMKITQVYGEAGVVAQELRLPSRYEILNPADLRMVGAANFTYGAYHKVLNEFEISRLKNAQTDEDIEIFNSLPPDVQKRILKGDRQILIPLDPKKTHFIFYKKQDYEPFAVPMGFPVLEAINAKAELMKIDMAAARSMQQIILLVTNGNEPEKHGINPKNLEAFRKLFTNQSVGRVLVADYTTKAEFIVPEIGDLLDPKKYEVIEREINIGLNNVFAGGEKFANQAQKVELFVARIDQARKAFLNNFLIPEVRRISKLLGFKNFPTPYLEDIELKDNINYAKIYGRLMEIGLLTPEQGLKAIESNTLPDDTTFIEEHKDYKKQRDDGLFEPLVGGGKGDEAGSPEGAKAMPKKVSPIGTSIGSEDIHFSATKVRDNLALASQLEEEVIVKLREKHDIKRMSKLQKEVAAQITRLIIANEEPENWSSNVQKYVDSPEDRNKERVNKILEIAAKHECDPYLASILLVSKK